MSIHLLPILCTLFVWWFATGVILYLNGLPRWTHKWTMLFTTIVLGLAFLGLVASRDDTRLTGAYIAFISSLMVWAWQEVAFLLGYVTGPRRSANPPGARGWQRFRYALQALLHHELALLVLGAAVVAITWNRANATGLQVFAVLWVMRQSAKLNVFFGVRNLNESWLPQHLQYLQNLLSPSADELALSDLGVGLDLAGGAGLAGGHGRPARPVHRHLADLLGDATVFGHPGTLVPGVAVAFAGTLGVGFAIANEFTTADGCGSKLRSLIRAILKRVGASMTQGLYGQAR